MKNIIITLVFALSISALWAQVPTRNVPVSVSPESVRTPVTTGEFLPIPPPPVRNPEGDPPTDDTPEIKNPEGLGPTGKPLRIIWGLHG